MRSAWTTVICWGVGLVVAVSCGSKSPELCQSGEDEDEDGQIDCGDADCWVAGGICREVCASVFDEDGDGSKGCGDSDCWSMENDCPEDCDSENDEDADGVVGCADPDCWIASERCPEICDSDNDEDADGAVSCADSDCWSEDAGCPEICGGGADEDVDGFTDCDDDDCFAEIFCIPTFAADTQPIFLEHCFGAGGACHSDTNRLGGLSFESYDDILLASNYCAGENKGTCSLLRILEPSMPENCLGCVPDEQVAILSRWVDGDLSP